MSTIEPNPPNSEPDEPTTPDVPDGGEQPTAESMQPGITPAGEDGPFQGDHGHR